MAKKIQNYQTFLTEINIYAENYSIPLKTIILRWSVEFSGKASDKTRKFEIQQSGRNHTYRHIRQRTYLIDK